MKCKLLVAEDELIERKVLCKTLQKYLGDLITLYEAKNGREAIEIFEREAPQAAILDIEMPGANGLEVARKIRETDKNCAILFLTGYDKFAYARQAISVRALDYLLKPYSFADFSRAAAKANSLYELRQGRLPAQPDSDSEATPKDREYISVKADYKVSLVRIAEIVYLESEGEYVRMHLADGSTITTLFRLKNMEAALPADTFMRVHRSYIVNLRCIKSYVKGRIFLGETEYVPIGENYKEAFQNYIDSHFRNL